MSYYNTTSQNGQELKDYTKKAETQEELILKTFQRLKYLTPSEAWKASGQEQKSPITSIRRAITDLTNSGALIKTEIKKDGLYGRPESVYKIAITKAPGTQTALF